MEFQLGLALIVIRFRTKGLLHKSPRAIALHFICLITGKLVISFQENGLVCVVGVLRGHYFLELKEYQ
ncbi:hypothetical protein IQ230_11340 [Gloeocapsopsis crepidinum LEGE 06123]|uniref:Transposase n=1 Tax=Gloeocapsopsis crepidinum LEGE 06123 TaxID=588587 RepID=A0ABR9USA3_9CHRO|nr:hypothetical protein [Gloeocapsopsis crepidinum]MBE9190933.1 hypothetical protein [Gloeocapsopsis crepidinum LEGE 06123]